MQTDRERLLPSTHRENRDQMWRSSCKGLESTGAYFAHCSDSGGVHTAGLKSHALGFLKGMPGYDNEADAAKKMQDAIDDKARLVAQEYISDEAKEYKKKMLDELGKHAKHAGDYIEKKRKDAQYRQEKQSARARVYGENGGPKKSWLKRILGTRSMFQTSLQFSDDADHCMRTGVPGGSVPDHRMQGWVHDLGLMMHNLPSYKTKLMKEETTKEIEKLESYTGHIPQQNYGTLQTHSHTDRRSEVKDGHGVHHGETNHHVASMGQGEGAHHGETNHHADSMRRSSTQDASGPGHYDTFNRERGNDRSWHV